MQDDEADILRPKFLHQISPCSLAVQLGSLPFRPRRSWPGSNFKIRFNVYKIRRRQLAIASSLQQLAFIHTLATESDFAELQIHTQMRGGILAEIMVALWSVVSRQTAPRPKALVYRGPAACDGCPEAVGELLESYHPKFRVVYAGPDEDVDFTRDSLKDATVCAFPGGPDLDEAWDDMKDYRNPIRDFVSAGGHYLGFCLGAYLAGHSPGFGLLPGDADTDSEIDQKGAQVKNDKDTIIEVNWTFTDGHEEKNRWLYFQEGSMIRDLDKAKMRESSRYGRVLATYSKSGDVAACVTPFGKGWVGLVGPHPEATKDWCKCPLTISPKLVAIECLFTNMCGTHCRRGL